MNELERVATEFGTVGFGLQYIVFLPSVQEISAALCLHILVNYCSFLWWQDII